MSALYDAQGRLKTVLSGSIASLDDIVFSGLADGNVLIYVAATSDWRNFTLDGAGIVAKTGAQTIAGVKTFSSFPVTPSSAPTTNYQVANKKYVDDSAPVADGSQSNFWIYPTSTDYTIVQGSWDLLDMGGGSFTSKNTYNSTHNDADEIKFPLYIAPGTYSLRWMTYTDPNNGIIEVYLDTTLLGTWDTYSAGWVNNVEETVDGIAVAASGLHWLHFKVNGKNVASGNHYLILQAFHLYKTGS